MVLPECVPSPKHEKYLIMCLGIQTLLLKS